MRLLFWHTRIESEAFVQIIEIMVEKVFVPIMSVATGMNSVRTLHIDIEGPSNQIGVMVTVEGVEATKSPGHLLPLSCQHHRMET